MDKNLDDDDDDEEDNNNNDEKNEDDRQEGVASDHEQTSSDDGCDDFDNGISYEPNEEEEESSSSVSDLSDTILQEPAESSVEGHLISPMPLAGGVTKRRVPVITRTTKIPKKAPDTAAPQQQSKERSNAPPQFKFDGNAKQQREYDCDSDEASYYNLGWEFKRRRLVTAEPKRELLPGNTRPQSSINLPTVDFDRIAASTSWGERVLFDTLSTEQVDELVGYANTLGEEMAVAFDTSMTTSSSNGDESGYNIQMNDSFPSQMLLGNRNPRQQNPMASVSSGPPLPLSWLNYIQTRAAKKVTEHASMKAAESRLGDSAAVVVGMAVEDAITASLLPLAGLHVLRCRALEHMAETEDSDSFPAECNKIQTAVHPVTGESVTLNMEQIAWKTENAFDEWTLPPDEAIMKLLEQGLTSNPSHHFLAEPCRQLETGSPAETEGLVSSTPSSANIIEAERIMLWSKRLNVAPSIIAANPEVMQIFMNPS
ncbi:hypothetical protein IV203_026380 [Nitzschia inconspicua]|uniref:Uncharacterized protein n=1 Tax=Nitzschia inconspicua TaxID=303405 RepID=A0A9K3LIH6_9STRA|nr:hypothetical protein IV203_026380 [Nitzschia inconspicua]